MERFPDELDLRKAAGGLWRLLSPFVYRSDRLGAIAVPAGFMTDLASVPWFARWYVSRDGDHTKAAIVHDWLYAFASARTWPDVSRLDADLVFLEALRALGVREGMALVLFCSVRIGGGRSFRRMPGE